MFQYNIKTTLNIKLKVVLFCQLIKKRVFNITIFLLYFISKTFCLVCSLMFKPYLVFSFSL